MDPKYKAFYLCPNCGGTISFYDKQYRSGDKGIVTKIKCKCGYNK